MIYLYIIYVRKFNLTVVNLIDTVYACATFESLVLCFANLRHGAFWYVARVFAVTYDI